MTDEERIATIESELVRQYGTDRDITWLCEQARRVGQLTDELETLGNEAENLRKWLGAYKADLKSTQRVRADALREAAALVREEHGTASLAAKHLERAALGEPTGWQCAECGWTAVGDEMGAALWPIQEGPHTVVELVCPNCCTDGTFIDYPAAASPVGDETPPPDEDDVLAGLHVVVTIPMNDDEIFSVALRDLPYVLAGREDWWSGTFTVEDRTPRCDHGFTGEHGEDVENGERICPGPVGDVTPKDVQA